LELQLVAGLNFVTSCMLFKLGSDIATRYAAPEAAMPLDLQNLLVVANCSSKQGIHIIGRLFISGRSL